MINCNPETVSTDYDTSDRLYFEPLTLEDVLEVVARRGGVAASSSASSCSSAARPPSAWRRASRRPGVPILGTTPDAIDSAEERGLFSAILDAGRPARPAQRHGARLRERRPRSPRRSATPSSSARRTCSAAAAWRSSTTPRRSPTTSTGWPTRRSSARTRPLLVDRFLDDAVEIDVDALYDGDRALRRRHHGAHRGGRHPLRRLELHPAARSRLGRGEIDRVRDATLADRRGHRRAAACSTCSSPSRAGVLYVIEANPRASRTVPFVSKALGIPLAKAASLDHGRARRSPSSSTTGCCPPRTARSCPLDSPISVKEAVLPFKRFRTKRGPGRRQRAQPRDALHRRGHGHRPRLPAGLR